MVRWREYGKGFTLVELLVVVALISLLLTMLLPTLAGAKGQAYKVRCLVHLQNLMKAHSTYASIYNMFLPGPEGIAAKPDPNTPYGRWATAPTETGLLAKAGVMNIPEMWLCPKAELSCPGIWYETYGYPWGNKGWTPELIKQNPYTYHFSYNARTFISPKDDRIVEPKNFIPGYKRRIDTFPDLSRTILLAEENTGMIPWQISYQVLQDPVFWGPDVTEPRHMGTSQAGYLDGHAGSLPPYICLFDNQDYWPVPPLP